MNDVVSASRAFQGLIEFLMLTYRAVLRLGDLINDFFLMDFNDLFNRVFDPVVPSAIPAEWANTPIVVAVFYLLIPLAVTGFIWNFFFKVIDLINPFG